MTVLQSDHQPAGNTGIIAKTQDPLRLNIKVKSTTKPAKPFSDDYALK